MASRWAAALGSQGWVVMPGLVDLAARLREPGHEHARMLQSELAAAVAGGVTSLVCPPDTDPVLDEPGLVDMLRRRAKALARARVYPMGALTVKLAGERLTEMAELAEASDLTEARVAELLRLSADPVSLSGSVGSDGDAELGDFIEDPGAAGAVNGGSLHSGRNSLPTPVTKIHLSPSHG